MGITHREDQLFAALGAAFVIAGIVAAALIVVWPHSK
jgi:hypothetical protein